ncbi:hypothetical protein NQ317_015228 [Molorchus minor]|uniref:Uncharacterized protein n=1 Tax=Molorchus minor TaxID=1323400 RepID=A0ABQ9J9W9_9CUCU|nr:hypothetical protein NQ317_015228 [Molorchus minor]
MEGAKDIAKEEISHIKREVDSIDDFEHLGHDSSPLNEIKENIGEINKRVEAVGNSVTDLFDPLKSDLLDKPLVPEKMDSNLLEMGDSFPDRKEADAKLDKFLQDFPSGPAHSPDKYNLENIKSFMDNERGFVEEPPKIQPSNDILDRYSDSEPDDDFKPSKYEDFSKKHELPESFGSTENFKTETFRDVDEIQPELPKKDYPQNHLHRNFLNYPLLWYKKKSNQHCPKILNKKIHERKQNEPDIVKEKTPEPVKEKVVEVVKEKNPPNPSENYQNPLCR